MNTWRLVTVLIVWLAGFGLVSSSLGCDQLKDLTGGGDKDEDEEDSGKKDKKKKKKSEDEDEESDGDDEKADAEPKPTAEPTQPASDPVEPKADESATTYPEQQEATGDYKLLKPLKVRRGAEDGESEIVELSSGTLVAMKATHQEWSLIEYDKPSEPATKEKGWVHALPTASDTFESTTAPAAQPEPTQPTQPKPTAPQPTQPQPTQPQPTQPQPTPAPTTTVTPKPPKLVTPCGCKVGDLACAIRCAQQGNKK